jgi:hypothetical protein
MDPKLARGCVSGSSRADGRAGRAAHRVFASTAFEQLACSSRAKDLIEKRVYLLRGISVSAPAPQHIGKPQSTQSELSMGDRGTGVSATITQ